MTSRQNALLRRISQTDTSQETDFASRAFASHRSSRLPSVIPDFQDYQQPPTLTTDYLKWEQFHRYTPFGNQHWSVSTTIHVQTSTLGGSILMRSSLATIDASSIMEVLSLVLRIQSVFIVFCNIPQTTEYLLLCCLYSTGITPTHRSSRTSSSQAPKKHSFDSANPAQYYANSAWKNFTDGQKQAVKDAWAAKKQARRNTRNNSATNQSTVPGDNPPDTNNTTSAGSQMGGRASS